MFVDNAGPWTNNQKLYRSIYLTSNSGGLAAFISIMFFSQIESFVVKSHLLCQAFLVIYEWFANMCRI